MSWIEYVRRVAGATTSQDEIAKAAKVTSPTVSRWLNAKQGVAPDAAANFARHYKRPVLEAFVAAEFLTAAEAKVRPPAAPDYSQLTNDELVELIRARLDHEGSGEHVRSAATSKQGSGPGVNVTESNEQGLGAGSRAQPGDAPRS